MLAFAQRSIQAEMQVQTEQCGKLKVTLVCAPVMFDDAAVALCRYVCTTMVHMCARSRRPQCLRSLGTSARFAED